MRRWTVRRLAENGRLKLAALALAVLLWAVVSAEQVTSRWLPVAVQVEVRDPEFVRESGPSPAEVSVRFSGPARELWELAVRRPTLVLRVDQVREGRSVYLVDPQMVRLPRELSVSASDVRPATVRLGFQRVATRDVPVRVVVAPESQRRWSRLDSLRPTPARVRVTGPAALLARITEVTTRPFAVGDDSLVSRRVALDGAGMETLRFDVGSVRVAGRVEPRTERVIPAVPVAVPDGFVAVPAAVEVRIEGGRSRVAALAPEAVTVGTSSAALPPTGGDVAVSVRGIAAGMTARVTPARVRLVPASASTPTREPTPMPVDATSADTTKETP